jgi:hypothetical protein
MTTTATASIMPAGVPEEARPVQGYPGYWVTESGEVYSARRGPVRKMSTRPVRFRDSAPVSCVNLCDPHGVQEIKVVARLVLAAFREAPGPNDVVVYRDDDHRNARLDNLEVLSKAEWMHRMNQGGRCE